MGMAASQARLLFITARLHDVELRAQQLLAAKIALATQQDAAWQKYNEAMDASVVTANTINMGSGAGGGKTIIGTFNNLTRPDTFADVGYGMRYGVVDTTDINNPALYLSGVHQKKYNEYKDSHGQGGDASSFAMHMMGLSGGDPQLIKAQEQKVFESERNTQLTELGKDLLLDLIDADYTNGTNEVNAHNKDIDDNEYGPDHEAWETEHAAWLEEEEDQRGPEPVEPQKTDAKYNYLDEYEKRDFGGNVHTAFSEAKLTDDEKAMFQEDMDEFSKLAQASFNEENYKAIVGEDAFDSKMYDYYSDMWNQIQEVGGNTKAIDSQVADSAEWLTEQVKRGNVQIWLYDSDGTDPEEEDFGDFEADSPSSSSSLSYTPTTEIDKEAQKKAEAEYEHTLKQIDNKEKKIDIELSKLETERNALTTEYDSVKQVIKDNVERTFGIFS